MQGLCKASRIRRQFYWNFERPDAQQAYSMTPEGLSHIICIALSALQVVPVMHSSTKLGKGTNELFPDDEAKSS